MVFPEIKTEIKKRNAFSRYQALNIKSWSPLPSDFSQPGGQNFFKFFWYSSLIPELSSRAKMRPIPSLVESKPLCPKWSISTFDDLRNHKNKIKTFYINKFFGRRKFIGLEIWLYKSLEILFMVSKIIKFTERKFWTKLFWLNQWWNQSHFFTAP